MAGTIVVFDFDSTIIECDSDNWVLDEFGLTEKFYQLLPSMPWNPLMDMMMNELHSQGKTIGDIVQVLNKTPMHSHIVLAIKAAYSLGCELKIMSDANIFFIEIFLKHHGVWNCFSEINANPSYVNEEGRLRIYPYHDYLKSSHGCNLCPPNMCKGLVIGKIQNSVGDAEKKKLIYLGDGNGDFCPSLKLKDSDHLMPRMNFPLCDLVSKNSNKIKAEVHAWRDGEELEQVLLHIINKAIGERNGISSSTTPTTISIDCKLGPISIDAHKPLPKARPVPH
ncbi:inorganic pyrophosphatase 2-like [Gastrolobium bilobum]|uniref:inorganic pyrophosphatase 2-like n=1 Tax=Gastrolobium bilobum TaxID=150636 RepID=UPI002AB22139|nr:inorganic pyrophosphatase 2-like [Gastrolobium bilobum]